MLQIHIGVMKKDLNLMQKQIVLRMVKTDFGLELQGYIIPDALNTKLAKKPQKFFSKSEVKFETEYVTSFDEPKTREEVRKETGEYKVGRKGEGIGYDNNNDDNTIG